MSSLARLPAELLVPIAKHLDTADAGDLRLACKATNAALTDWYRSVHYAYLDATATEAGVAALAEIAARPELAKYVREIGLTAHLAHDPGQQPAQDDPLGTADAGLGPALGAVLARLPRVERLVVHGVHWTQPRDADAIRPSASSAPLGLEQCFALQRGPQAEHIVTGAFRALLFALGDAHAARAEAGYAPIRELHYCSLTGLGNGVFELGADLRARLEPALARIERLHLVLAPAAEPNNDAVEFLKLCGNVTTLVLSSVPHCFPSGLTCPLNWMSDSETPAVFPNLVSLHLTDTMVHIDVVFRLLTKCRRLEKMAFTQFCLMEDDSIATDDDDDKWLGAVWYSLLAYLSEEHKKSPLPLAELLVEYLDELTLGANRKDAVWFVDSLTTGERTDKVTVYAADDHVHFDWRGRLPYDGRRYLHNSDNIFERAALLFNFVPPRVSHHVPAGFQFLFSSGQLAANDIFGR
ncbi:hypothetical protein Q8F55_008506 [Vanrija albida]|uniref:F-box domain-containing protein n=1 Tax=Vanrija albida TaxID=181172 RepID=A0ABR3PR17_9TREE